VDVVEVVDQPRRVIQVLRGGIAIVQFVTGSTICTAAPAVP
jgi:hypothetical protein